MKRLLTLTIVVAALLAPLAAQAQYYYYGYGYYYPRTYPVPGYYAAPAPTPPQAAPQNQGATLYKRWRPDPRVLRRWDRHNRMMDFENVNRSPTNPESDLEYMLRTF